MASQPGRSGREWLLAPGGLQTPSQPAGPWPRCALLVLAQLGVEKTSGNPVHILSLLPGQSSAPRILATLASQTLPELGGTTVLVWAPPPCTVAQKVPPGRKRGERGTPLVSLAHSPALPVAERLQTAWSSARPVQPRGVLCPSRLACTCDGGPAHPATRWRQRQKIEPTGALSAFHRRWATSWGALCRDAEVGLRPSLAAACPAVEVGLSLPSQGRRAPCGCSTLPTKPRGGSPCPRSSSSRAVSSGQGGDRWAIRSPHLYCCQVPNVPLNTAALCSLGGRGGVTWVSTHLPRGRLEEVGWWAVLVGISMTGGSAHSLGSSAFLLLCHCPCLLFFFCSVGF